MSAARASSTRRLLVLTVVIAGLALLVVACGDDGSPAPQASATQAAEVTGKLTIFAYEDGLVPEAIGGFEEANPGLEIKTAAFGTNDEAVAKMRAGFSPDVVNVCVEETPRMVGLDLLQPLDTNRITDWSSVVPALQTIEGVVVNGQVYMVPTTGGTAGIVYNPEEVPQGIASWKALFEDPALKGRITLEDSAATVIPIAALALGYEDPFHLTDEDLDRVEDYLLAHKSQVRAFFSGDANFLNLYKSGDVAAGFAWHDFKVTAEREGVPAEYVVPSEGQLTWVCGYGIASDAENLDAAYAALNWYNSPEPQAFYAESYTYWVFNQRTLEILPQEVIDSIGLDQPEQLQQAIPLVIPANYDRWLRVFQKLKGA